MKGHALRRCSCCTPRATRSRSFRYFDSKIRLVSRRSRKPEARSSPDSQSVRADCIASHRDRDGHLSKCKIQRLWLYRHESTTHSLADSPFGRVRWVWHDVLVQSQPVNVCIEEVSWRARAQSTGGSLGPTMRYSFPSSVSPAPLLLTNVDGRGLIANDPNPGPYTAPELVSVY